MHRAKVRKVLAAATPIEPGLSLWRESGRDLVVQIKYPARQIDTTVVQRICIEN